MKFLFPLKWLTYVGCLSMLCQAQATDTSHALNTMESDVLINTFILFNFLRIVFYIPGFLKMAKATSNLDTHSLFMWCCWIFANITTTLVFLVQQGHFTSAVWLNLMNTMMCCVGFGLILYKRIRYSGQSESTPADTTDDMVEMTSRKTATGLPLEYLRHAA